MATAQHGDPPTPRTDTTQTDEGLKARAKQLYQEGVAAYRAGSYSEAIDKLLEADRVMPNAAFSYNIALVYQAMNDKRSALRWLRSCLRQSADKQDKAALEKVRTLEAELQAKGLQQVTILSKPAGATLRIDGNALGITPFTTEIVPGSHSVTLSLDGFKTAHQAFELRPDRSIDVDIALETDLPKANAPPLPQSSPAKTLASDSPSAPIVVQPPSSSISPPPDTTPHSRSIRPLTWITFGVGAALVGGSGYFELKRASAETDARNASQLDYQTNYDRMKSHQTTARILAVGGAVALTAGVVLLTVDLTRSGPVKTASVRDCGIAGLCTSLEGHF